MNAMPLFLLFSAIITLANGQFVNEECDSSHLCFHGGVCEKGTIGGTGESIQVCNCDKAFDEDENKYVGIYCEHQVPKVDSFEGMKKDQRLCNSHGGFCLHDGICRDVNDNDPDICTCTDEYTGAHCEIAKIHKAIQKLSNGSGECDMVCRNGGKCQFGINTKRFSKESSFSEGKLTDVGEYFYQHCVCKKGFFGYSCESKHETCGDDDIRDELSKAEAAEHYCHHGGTCVDMFAVGSHFKGQTSSERYTCDCSAGNELFANVAFAGKYCEVQSTSICSDRKDDFNGKQFCANYGSCVGNSNRVFRCSCPDGYTGDHCEFDPSEEAPVPEGKKCTKTVCQNGGICQFGMKDHGVLSEMTSKPGMAENLGSLIPENANENYEHCICPEGYAGTSCEHVAEVCPGGEHICFHGSKCIKNVMNEDYSCSCNEGRNFYDESSTNNLGSNDDDGLGDDEVDENWFNNYYQGGTDGKQNIDDDEDRRSLQGGIEGQVDLGGTHCQFKATSRCGNGHSCFNGGVCSQNRCICHDGFKGTFCALVSSNENHKNAWTGQSTLKNKHQSTVVLFTFSLAFLGVASVLLVVAYTRVQVESHNNEKVAQRHMMETFTAATISSRTEQDVTATFLPFPTNSPVTGARNSETNGNDSTHSGDMSPAEDKTVAELI